MTTSSAPPLVASIDELLGPAEGRFFGRGFRRVAYDIADVHVGPGPQGEVTARTTVGVRYPADWSKKKAGSDLRPHFSTVDGIVVAAQLAEVCLRGTGGDLRDAWLRGVRLSAGSTPQEDLAELRTQAVLRGSEPTAPGRAVSRVDCAIGTMRVRMEVEHAMAGGPASEPDGASLESLLGPAPDRYFGTGFTRRTQHIEQVETDSRLLRARSVLTLSQDDSAQAPRSGLEGAHQPSVSVIDAFVTALQLAQVMLYDLDGMRRQDSNTLWMRQTTLTATRPDRGDARLPVQVALEDARLRTMGGRTWRTLDITGELPGLRVRSAVAHQLPEGHRVP
ncbi:AvrD family protein [Streptomyces sp. NBC_00247]|uniref:AvrD family protein n=1 Tax=Streptomyces sp. NBC_00247 TaxID=2975689 RepID=UPI002E290A72|nr:AvrD family protein [Streptomyces sp. NBC_00247]